MKKIIILITLLFIPFIVDAEELKVEWQKSWGGSSYDSFTSSLLFDDGSFIIVGRTESIDIDNISNKGSTDVVIIKYNKDGNVIWQKTWGGSGYDSAFSIIKTESDGFVIVCETTSSDIEGIESIAGTEAMIVKFDKNGNIEWQKSWGGNHQDCFNSIETTLDGGFIVTGYSASENIDGIVNEGYEDAIIIKYDKDGNVVWQKNWGGESNESFDDILYMDDNSFIVVGQSASSNIEELPNKGETDAIILKYDKDGNLLWQKSWGGDGNDFFEKLIQTENGEYIVVGQSASSNIDGIINKGAGDAIILKYDKDGNLIWQKSWGGNDNEVFYDIRVINNIGFILVGNISSTNTEDLTNKGGFDALIIKCDTNGNIIWQKSWGGSGSEQFIISLLMENNSMINIGISNSEDIEGMLNKGNLDGILVKYLMEYNLENIVTENGTSVSKQRGSLGVITPTPNEGYEVDTIIVKDINGNTLDIEITKLEDGTYSFPLYTDVSVEVLFKEKLVNPKTGIVSYIGEILAILFISISTFCVLVFNKKSYRL